MPSHPELVQSGAVPTAVVQSEVVQVAPAVHSEEPDSPVGSTTVSETNMNTVSEGEWILKSDGQLTPTGEAYRGNHDGLSRYQNLREFPIRVLTN